MKYLIGFLFILFLVLFFTVPLAFGIYESDRMHKKWNKNNKIIYLGKMNFMFLNYPKTSKEMSKFAFTCNVSLYSYVFVTIIIAGVFAFIIPNLNILLYCTYSIIILPIGIFLISMIEGTRFYKEKHLEKKNKLEMSGIVSIVKRAVRSVLQTYVDSLKKEGKFDKEAQARALELARTRILAELNVEAREFITANYGDLNAFITNQIEATINLLKK
ncbi:MAG: hypothetical protein LKE36_06030 [Bacilli bacterium]|jgi:hypothetical protein|nr:hypothetical protein [Bacilli bacterium]